MIMTRKIFLACAAAAVASVALGGIASEASAGGRVLSGNVVTNKPVVHNTVTLRDAQGHRIPGRSLNRTTGRLLCTRLPSGGQRCQRVN